VTVFGSVQQISENDKGTEMFSSAEELRTLAMKWTGTRLVEIWNSLPGVEPVARLTSRKAGVTRIWKAIQQLQPGNGAGKRKGEGKKARAKKKAVRKERPVIRKISKTARVIALLRQPAGAKSEDHHACHRVAGPQRAGIHQRSIGQEAGLARALDRTQWRARSRDPPRPSTCCIAHTERVPVEPSASPARGFRVRERAVALRPLL
jgi:hypothetical protein